MNGTYSIPFDHPYENEILQLPHRARLGSLPIHQYVVSGQKQVRASDMEGKS